MLPFEILGKLFEIVLSTVFGEEYARKREPKRRFALKLLGVYEDLETYSGYCREFVEKLDRERRLVPSGKITPGTARDLRKLAESMADLVASMIHQFGNDVYREYIQAKHSRDQARARTILKIIDPNFVSLFDTTLESDDATVNFLDVLTCRLVDRTHIAFVPEGIDGANRLPRGDSQRYEETIGQMISPIPARGFQDLAMTFDLTDDQQFQAVCRTLTRSIEDADQLAKAIGAHLRERFTLDDLL